MDKHIKELKILLADILPASKTSEIIEKNSINEVLNYLEKILIAQDILEQNIWTYSNNVSYEVKNIQNSIQIFLTYRENLVELLNKVLNNYDEACLIFKEFMLKKYEWFDSEMYHKVVYKFLNDVGNSDYIMIQPNPIDLLTNHPFHDKDNVVEDLVSLSLLMYKSN